MCTAHSVPASWPQDGEVPLNGIRYDPDEDIFLIPTAGGMVVDYSGERAVEVLRRISWEQPKPGGNFYEQLLVGSIDDDFLSELREPEKALPPPPVADPDLSQLDQPGDYF